MKAYKVFVDNAGRPEFLYHGLRGSKIITLDKWLEAEVKWAREGSNPYYYTAFHVYMSLDIIRRWVHSVRKFENRFVAEVMIGRTRPKPTKGQAILAERMRLTPTAWNNRTELTEYVQ